MKILIITFTSGNNPGTFFQAMGVQTAMRRIWPEAEVDFLRFPDFKACYGRRDKGAGWLATARQKAMSAWRLLRYRRLWRRNATFVRATDIFDFTEADERLVRGYDLVAIGSDTILEQAYGKDGRIGLNWLPLDVPKIYFAASASPANFQPDAQLAEVAAQALYIGLRDKLTIAFFRDKLGIEPAWLSKQPDPSYFIDASRFRLPSRLAARMAGKGQLALCNFSSDCPLRKAVAGMLRRQGYTVVATQYDPNADICLDTIDAYEWAGVFREMGLVVTERFHDSVFALRNGKPVIAIDWSPDRFSADGDSKTLRILQDYGHDHLHFNLCGTTDIAPVEEAVRNIATLFSPEKVEQANKRIKDEIEMVAEKVKAAVGK